MTPLMLKGYTRSPDGLYRKPVHFPSTGNSRGGWSPKVMVRSATIRLVRCEKHKTP